MSIIGKTMRLSEIIDPTIERSVLVEVDREFPSKTHCGREMDAIMPRLARCEIDGIIMEMNNAKKYIHYFHGKDAPALLIRMSPSGAFGTTYDATNQEAKPNAKCSSGREVLGIGASAAVGHFFVGHEKDQDEAWNFAWISGIIGECDELGIPLIVEAIPIGDRATRDDYSDCAGLAARMASEAGASCVAIPYTGSPETLRKVTDSTGVPTYLVELREKLSIGQPDYKLEALVPIIIETKMCGMIISPPGDVTELERINRLAARFRGG